MKTWLIIAIALALLVCLLLLSSQPPDPVAPMELDTSQGPAFEVQVVKPRINRPLFGLLPEGRFGFPASTLTFGHASPGAEIGRVEPDRLEFRADGWDLLIEFDGDGHVAPGTRLVFPIELANKQMNLRCRIAEGASGHLSITTLAGSDELAGSFVVKLANCELADTGKAVEWPAAALTVRGSFAGVPRERP